MEIRDIEIKRLKPSGYNPRRDLLPDDEDYKKLEASIDKWDLVEPLVWNERTGNLISGHQRLKICKKRGDKTIPVVVVNLSDTKEQLLSLALNKISGSWDYEKLSEVLREYTPEDLGITGLSDEEIEGLTSAANEAVQATLARVTNEKTGAIQESDATKVAAREVFLVYLSFSKKTEALIWLKKNGYEDEFSAGRRTLIIEGELSA